jgi:hypothetical protein
MSSCSIWSVRGPAAILAAVAGCAPLVGCQTPLDRAWGLSQRAHLAQSIANPDAGLHDVAAPRVDGTSTDAALFKVRSHEASTEEKEPQAAKTIINVGSGK